MKSLTLHNIDDSVYLKLREIAVDQNLSLNATAKSMIGDAVGINLKKKKRDISMLFGMMSKEEWDEFDKRIEEAFEQIDEEDWK